MANKTTALDFWNFIRKTAYFHFSPTCSLLFVTLRHCSLLFRTVPNCFLLNFNAILQFFKKIYSFIILCIVVFVIVFSCPELAVTAMMKNCHWNSLHCRANTILCLTEIGKKQTVTNCSVEKLSHWNTL